MEAMAWVVILSKSKPERRISHLKTVELINEDGTQYADRSTFSIQNSNKMGSSGLLVIILLIANGSIQAVILALIPFKMIF
jgi:hypothetical protein